MDDLFDNNDNNDNDDTSNKDTDDEHNNNNDDDDDDDENGNNRCTAPPQNEADTMEEEEENNDNPAKIALATRNQDCKEERRHDWELGETMNNPQNDLNDDKGLGAAPPRRSEQEHETATMMTCDGDFKSTMKKSHAQVVRGQMKQKKANTQQK